MQKGPHVPSGKALTGVLAHSMAERAGVLAEEFRCVGFKDLEGTATDLQRYVSDFPAT